MTSDETAGQTPLWGDSEHATFTANPTEDAVVAAIQSLNAANALTPMQLAQAQVCRSLARSVDMGNRKGRAVAGEAVQLANLLNQLVGHDPDAETEGTMPRETREFADALAAPPRLDTPSASDLAEL